jgi:hypothetical protein
MMKWNIYFHLSSGLTFKVVKFDHFKIRVVNFLPCAPKFDSIRKQQ